MQGDFGPTIAELKGVANAAANQLILCNDTPTPDWELLDLCSDALHAIKQMERARALYHAEPRTELLRLMAEASEWEAKATQGLRRAAKIKATTGAGFYAKALLVRSSSSGAAVLAMSLAEEFIECEALRQSLWRETTEERVA